MPFYYDVQRLEKNPIFVHEEIKLPKTLFGNSIFNATVNRQPISGRTLAINPFTSPNAVILHYLINKNDVIKIANEWQQREGSATTSDSTNSSTAASLPVSLESGGAASNKQSASGMMEFALTTTPPENPAATEGGTANGTIPEGQPTKAAATSVNTTSTDLLTDTGGIHVNVQWPPALISMNTSAKFNFTDAFSGGDLNANIMYDISVLDSNGKQVFEKKGLNAKDSQDTQNIEFPSSGTYQLVLIIKGIQQTSNDQKSEAPPVDNTRNGIARGTVVVSEKANSGNQTASAPPVLQQPTTTFNNSQLTELPQQVNQTASAPPVLQQPATSQQSDNSSTELQQEQQNPLEQLGQTISNMFGGGK